MRGVVTATGGGAPIERRFLEFTFGRVTGGLAGASDHDAVAFGRDGNAAIDEDLGDGSHGGDKITFAAAVGGIC